MAAKLAGGLHPDSAPDFWRDFSGSPERMNLPEQGAVGAAADGFFSWFRKHDFFVVGGLALFLTALAGAIGVVVIIRRVRAGFVKRAA
jgi:hypothetical protein